MRVSSVFTSRRYFPWADGKGEITLPLNCIILVVPSPDAPFRSGRTSTPHCSRLKPEVVGLGIGYCLTPNGHYRG